RLREALGDVVVVDRAGVDQDVVREDVGEHEEHQQEPADAHEHPPGELDVGGVGGPGLAERARAPRPHGGGLGSHHAPPTISGMILNSTGIPMTAVTPSTPYHSARW